MVPIVTRYANLDVAAGVVINAEGATLGPANAIIDDITLVAGSRSAAKVFRAIELNTACIKYPGIRCGTERKNDGCGDHRLHCATAKRQVLAFNEV
jgi:hypothetical protein